MELFNALGLDLRILLAQLINFAVLVFVLYRFGYKPILSFLDERRTKIEKGIKNAKKAEENLEDIAKKEKEVLAQARKEAQEIISLAKDTAEKSKTEIMAKAQEESQKLAEAAKLKIEEEKNRIIREIKSEVAELVSLAVERVVRKKMDPEMDKKIIEDSLSDKQ